MSETSVLFTLRDALPKDCEFINSFTFAEGMDVIDDIEGIVVAVNSEDETVGFIRIVKDDDGIAHVNPIITYASWRGFGVGRALIEDAHQKHGELRLVSRGASIGFYRALGFEECSWDLIGEGLSEDCDNCSWRDECGPLPMRLLAS